MLTFTTPGTGATFSGNVETVPFPPGTLGSPGNQVVRATVGSFACAREATAGFGNTVAMSATAPGTGGFSSRPDLTAVTVDTSSTPATADFTFDETLTGAPSPAGSVRVVGSDGLIGCSNSAPGTIVNGNTLRVELDAVATNSVDCNANAQNEFFVWADVAAGAVTAASGPNPQAGVPTGANAGAFANGFTTGPEAFSTTFNNSTGVVSIVLDQRFASSVTLGNINLVDDSGSELPATPTTVAGAGGAAGPALAQAQFTPGEVSGARSLLLDGGAFTTQGIGGVTAYPNVDQMLAPQAGAPKRQHRHGHVVRHKATHHKSHARTNKRAAKRLHKHHH